jgi:cytochrome c peroxidase
MLATAAAGILLLPAVRTRAQQGQPAVPNLAGFADATGVLRTYAQSGNIDLTNPFFQALGTNGRACATCHQPSDAMGLSAAHAQLRFDQSQGLEPLFRTNDGSNCDHNIDTSTLQGRRAAYSLMRTRAVLRVSIPVPAARDFEVVSVVNPYGCSETNVISMYRRPLPGSGLKFLSAVMWDGRESSSETGTTPITFGNYPQSLAADLAHRALDATMGHAQGIALTAAQQQSIVALEMGLSSAQAEDRSAGNLSAMGATGGPLAMSQQGFYIGVNDPVGLDPNNPVPLHFNTRVFNLYDGWQEHGNPHMQAIARGQQIFNTRTFTITGVAGLNGATFSNGVTAPQSIVSTCGICRGRPQYRGGGSDRRRQCPRRQLPAGRDDLPEAESHHLRPDDRPGPRDDHRPFRGCRQIQRAGTARSRRAGSLLPQRQRAEPGRCRHLLRQPLPHRPDRPGKVGLGGVFERALIRCTGASCGTVPGTRRAMLYFFSPSCFSSRNNYA